MSPWILPVEIFIEVPWTLPSPKTLSPRESNLGSVDRYGFGRLYLLGENLEDKERIPAGDVS